jgi:phosphate-selective porin OprO/OprP
MTNSKTVLCMLLGSSALCWATTAMAQEPTPANKTAVDGEREATADPSIPEGDAIDEAQAKIELLQAQVEALREALEAVKASMVKATPSWRGAPFYEDKGGGWSFKPRGRIQYDAGWVSNPHDNIITRDLGFNTRVRSVRLGAEGTIPGDFGYKFEMDYANSGVGFGDAILTYTPKGKPWSFTVGNHQTFQGLEQVSSLRFVSFMERAQMNDAFNHARRIGASFGLANKAGTARFNAGLFAAHSIDGGFDNEGWIAAARGTYSPQVMGGMLHLGANFEHRKFQSNNGATTSNSIGAPSTNQLARYRARPFTQTTDIRFVDTGSFVAKSDNIIGLELAGIFKSFHFASEAQWTKVNSYEAGDSLDAGLDQFPSASEIVPNGDPTFFSAYGEVGYYFTGETRGYKNGQWDRTKVLKPFSKGGWGALQLNARVDYLDLDSNKLKYGFSNDFATGVAVTSTGLGRGGKQLGYLAGLTWIPEDYFRVLLNYAHADITGGPQAATVKPTSSKPVDKRKYGVDVVATRVQVDF